LCQFVYDSGLSPISTSVKA